MALLDNNSASFPWMLQAVWPCLARVVHLLSAACAVVLTLVVTITIIPKQIQMRAIYMHFNETVGGGDPTTAKQF